MNRVAVASNFSQPVATECPRACTDATSALCMPFDLLMNGQGPVGSSNSKVKRRTPAGRIQNGLTARVVGPGRDGQQSEFVFGYRITCCQHHNVFYAQHTFKVAEVKAWSSDRKLSCFDRNFQLRCTSVVGNSKDICQIAQEAKFVFPPSVWHHSISRATSSQVC